MLKGLNLLIVWAAAVSTVSGHPSNQEPLSPSELTSGISKVREELVKAEIISTVIGDFEPSFLLNAEWSSDVNASLGNTVKVDDVQDQPSITMRLDASGSSSSTNRASNVTYAITLTDPDAPSRDDPKWSEICHFIATGVSLSSSTTSISLSELTDVIPYKAPGPPPKTGKHRYVFLVFAPVNGTTDALNLTKPNDRQHWGTGKERHGVRNWAEENGLRPVAANFIYAQNEEQ